MRRLCFFILLVLCGCKGKIHSDNNHAFSGTVEFIPSEKVFISESVDSYEHSYTIGMLQGNDFKLVRMICPRSPVYLEYEYLSGFKGVLFTVCDDSLFFSFEADSKIYRMDLNDEKVVAFGCAGEDMNTDYPERKSLEESDEYLWEDHQKYGHYYDLKYIPETSVLFRSFRHGSSCKEDGLQVYKNTCLVAEYKVPKEFKVIGYFPPYYYAAGETGDEEDERMVIYRFCLF